MAATNVGKFPPKLPEEPGQQGPRQQEEPGQQEPRQEKPGQE